MKIFCAYKGPYPNGMAMANRLYLYAKTLSFENISFLVASEGTIAKSVAESPKNLFEHHDFWHWRKPSRLSSLPLIGGIFAQLTRKKLHQAINDSEGYSVLFVAGYRWFDLLLLKRTCRRNGMKMVMELNELPHSIISGRMDSKWLNAIKRFITLNLVFHRMDGFIVISEQLEKLALKYNKSAKICKVPILTDNITNLEPYITANTGKPFIFHAGTLTEEKDGILEVVEAFGRFHQSHKSELTFEFSNKRTLPQIIKKIEVILDNYAVRDKVVFHNHLIKAELERKFRTCAMVVINKPYNRRNSYNFSTKLGECMSFSIPLISTAVGESRNYLEHGQNALIIKNSKDAEEISSHIASLMNDDGLRKRIAKEAALTAKQHFYFGAHQNRLSEFFKTI